MKPEIYISYSLGGHRRMGGGGRKNYHHYFKEQVFSTAYSFGKTRLLFRAQLRERQIFCFHIELVKV